MSMVHACYVRLIGSGGHNTRRVVVRWPLKMLQVVSGNIGSVRVVEPSVYETSSAASTTLIAIASVTRRMLARLEGPAKVSRSAPLPASHGHHAIIAATTFPHPLCKLDARSDCEGPKFCHHDFACAYSAAYVKEMFSPCS